MILTALARSCFIRRLDFGNYAIVLDLEAQSLDRGTVPHHGLDGAWPGCDYCRYHKARQDAHIGLCFSRKVPDSYTGILWLRMEEAILIIASSASMLKSLIEHVFHRLGLPKFQPRIRKLTSFHFSNPTSQSTPRLHHQRSQQELLGYKQPFTMPEPGSKQ